MKKSIRSSFLLLLLSSLLGYAQLSSAGIAVIVNPDNPLDELSQKSLSLILQGKKGTFPDGDKLELIDRKLGSQSRERLYREVTGLSVAQIRAMWSKKVYAGLRAYPSALSSTRQVKTWVANHKDSIGYINSRDVDDSVKVVYQLTLSAEAEQGLSLPESTQQATQKLLAAAPDNSSITIKTPNLPEPMQEDYDKKWQKQKLQAQKAKEEQESKSQKVAKLGSGELPLDLSDIESSIDEYNDFCQQSDSCETI